MEEIFLLLQGNTSAGFMVAFCIFCLIAASLIAGICFIYILEIKAINKKYSHEIKKDKTWTINEKGGYSYTTIYQPCHKQKPLSEPPGDER